jgi:Sigma-54 interaction domain
MTLSYTNAGELAGIQTAMTRGEEQQHEASRLVCRAGARLGSRVEEGARVINQDAFEPSPPLEVSLLCTTDEGSAPRSLLVEGPGASTDAVLRRLEPYFREPVMWKRRGAPLEVPAGEIGALILQDVDGLSAEEQTQLIRWIDANPRTTIVSTAAHRLFPLVARGHFDSTLYYRLNIVLLHLA